MRICVYCSSSSALDAAYNHAAEELGRLIGEHGHSLVYGGSCSGTMGLLARAARQHGAHVVGVLTQQLYAYGLLDEAVNEVILTASMAERKAAMEQRAEAFVALPGGFGTLEELLQVLTLKQLHVHQAPVVLVNIEHTYDPLLAFFETLYSRRFAKEDYRQLYLVVATPGEALERIEHYHAPTLPDKWYG